MLLHVTSGGRMLHGPTALATPRHQLAGQAPGEHDQGFQHGPHEQDQVHVALEHDQEHDKEHDQEHDEEHERHHTANTLDLL